ncbi:M23 family metallopeptidase [Anaerofustis stercorihominis]|uniref:M23 family metallopeptidase n=1 Tax=Anaerofustis TaxID=264995 RepID=UPI001106C1CC|nr:M23 family metallopeptidase [Anaerofustis stercorihominis]MCO8193331.1 M23 family metallopeptidase [Anaerofustis sp. NSJ-163]
MKKRIRKKIKMGQKEKFLSKICVAFSVMLILGVMFGGIINKSNLNVADVGDDRVEEKSVMNEELNKGSNKNKSSESLNINNEDKTEETKDDENIDVEENEKTKDVLNTAKLDLSNISRPVQSAEIIMDYSYNTTPVYSNTLQEYISDHKGIDLKSNKNENVKSILYGKVKRVYYDERLGYSVEIDHGNNLYSIYSNLNKKLNVEKGDIINKGEVIGTVGKSSSFEIADDYHLHFEVKQGADNINPSTLLK